MCVESATASALVNESPSGEFSIKRGIRQRDPLSPFLFILAAEGLSILTRTACDLNLLKAAKVCASKVSISHLQYADNVVFLCDREPENLIVIKRILRLYEIMSGLKVNFRKSKLFGINISEEELQVCADLLGCGTESGHLNYLGMKIDINNHRKGNWEWFSQRLRNRLATWDGRNIAMGGRATLVQSVLPFIPIYTLSFHLLSKIAIRDLIHIQRSFLWGGTESN